MKHWLGLLVVTYLSLFLIGQTVTTPTYQATEDFDYQESLAIFNNKQVAIPSFVAQKNPILPVLGDTTAEKKIYVDLTNQRLYAFEGENLIYDFLVSTGKWGRTPTGVFTIWSKFRYTKMSGGSTALRTYYYLPNVPFVMFFSNDQVAASRGFSLHGTYWHNNFGHPMSHGCVNMKTSEAELIYRWAHPTSEDPTKSVRTTGDNPGTTIIIYGVAPKS